MPRCASSARISSSVRSGTVSIRCNSQDRSPLKRELWSPPIGLAHRLPLSRHTRTHSTTVLAANSNTAAALRRDRPPSTARTTRSRKSREYGRAMHAGPLPSMQLESHLKLQRNPLLRFLQTGYRSSSSEQALFFEAFVHVGDELAVAVPHQGRPALVGAEDALGGLAPAGMRHLRVHIGPKAVFARLQRLPVGFRPLVGEFEADDRLDRFEAVFPRHRKTQRRAVLLRHRFPVHASDEEGKLV